MLNKLFSGGISEKLIRIVILFGLFMGAAFIAMSGIQIALLKKKVIKEENRQSAHVEEAYKESMSEASRAFLLQLITWAADKTDDEFWIIDHDIRTLRTQVEAILREPEHYERIPVSPPEKENGGKWVMQILYPEGKEKADPDTVAMMERLANLAPMMKEILVGNEGYSFDVCIAAPDGVLIVMDEMSDRKQLDEKGTVADYDPRTRPWYTGAVEKGDVFSTYAIGSAFYDFDEVVFGAPVYVDGKLAAVIECATKIDLLKQKINERNVGKDGFSILVTRDGQLVCSPKTEGELRMREDPSEDIRGSINPELLSTVECALSGEIGVDTVHVDGELYFAAHAPIDVVDWIQITFVSAKEQEEPTAKLLAELDESTDSLLLALTEDFNNSTLLMLVVLILIMTAAITFAARRTRQRTAPIQRLEAEMDAARDIQFRMLPRREPDFHNKPGYELYSEMVPAKQVGGDMYDFFYLDEDHLVLTIGDVSGKGITAALFMALSKQVLKSQMLLQGGDVAKAMKEANLLLLEESVDAMFVTVWMGVVTLSTGVVEFVNGGHLYAALKRGRGDFVLEEDEHSVLLGGLSFAKFKKNTLQLEKGDMLYLYTDGVTEAHNGNEELFGETGLLQALNEVKQCTPEEIDRHVREKVAEFAGDTEQYDDMTTLCFQYLGI